MLKRFRDIIEYLAGEREITSLHNPPSFLAGRHEWMLRTLLWICAVVLIYAFCGQSSKFIYIDF